MLKLGHIVYSNCFPVHAGIVTGRVKFPFEIVEGVPSELNRLLYEGKVDVSPSSSIEYAVNHGKYLLLPDLSITSRTRAMSIVFRSRAPIEGLDGMTVALTTASATSVVLLRIILELQNGVYPNYITYEQGSEDPWDRADAALTIGDLALKQASVNDRPYMYDLGELWHKSTGLPFVFALWQVNCKKNIDKDLGALYDILKKSKEYGMSRLRELSVSHAEKFGMPAQTLFEYWNSFSYSLGEVEQKGLLKYFGYAAELGVIGNVPDIRFWTPE